MSLLERGTFWTVEWRGTCLSRKENFSKFLTKWGPAASWVLPLMNVLIRRGVQTKDTVGGYPLQNYRQKILALFQLFWNCRKCRMHNC